MKSISCYLNESHQKLKLIYKLFGITDSVNPESLNHLKKKHADDGE